MAYTPAGRITAIKDVEYDEVLNTLSNKADRISELFSNIEMEFYDLNEFFKGEVADSIQEKFEVYKNQISTLKANLESYQKDLINIRKYHENFDEENSLSLVLQKEEKDENARQDTAKREEYESGIDLSSEKTIVKNGGEGIVDLLV